MYYLRELFGKGKYGIYIAFAVLTETQRNYMLPKTKVYAKLKAKVLEELKYSDPSNDHQDITLQTLSEQDKGKLKTVTKKQVSQVQNITTHNGSTTWLTCSILGLGALNYFIAPTACGFFVSSYLTLLAADFMKSMFAIKYGSDPLWSWKMKDLGYLMVFSFGIVTLAVLTKSGLAKLKERSMRGLVVKDMPESDK